MSNAIYASSSTLSGNVLTLTFKVAAGDLSIFNFDMVFAFDQTKVSGITSSGPAGWSYVPNATTGELTVGAFTTNETAITAGQVAVTVNFTLVNAAEPLSFSYSGGYNDPTVAINSTAVQAAHNFLNSPVTGNVTITGTVTEDQVLTANTAGLSDGDGIGTLSYQWLRDGTDVAGATSATYALGDADVGKPISVRVSYTDGNGNAESKTSAATVNVVNVNDAPTGAVTIAGSAVQGQTLTASNTLADLDGLGAISYQWTANGANIAGATSSTLVLTQAQVGATIAVKATYTDARGAAEMVSSAATLAVQNLNDAPTGTVTIGGSAVQGQTLTASNSLADLDGMGTVTYQWLADGTDIAGATGTTLVLGQAQVGKAISVRASYTDAFTQAESVTSTATTLVQNVNDLPAGTVTIGGTATQGQTLTASNTLSDVDGMTTVTYQWKADGANIAGATGSTLVLTQAQVGKAITVTASYTDLQGTPESVTSSASAAVANVNDPATGGVTFSGTATQGQTLTAANTLADIDGLTTVTYQWLADGVAIAGATGSTLLLGQAQVGKAISVRGSFTDALGGAESATSTASTAVANVNDAPTGTVLITGPASVNQTLTVSNTLVDLDGIAGVISYQWMRGGVDVAGATNTTYQLTGADLGAQMSVRASYTDGFGQAEVVTSAATAAVIPNTPPTGAVTVTGTMAQNQTLSVTNNLADADNGIATAITYQWYAADVAIAGATGTSYTLTQAEVGKVVTARASYTDGLGTPETVSSTPGAAVANVNDPVTGTVTFTGTATQGQTLTAANTLADVDGMTTVTYQWKADGANIAGATGSTLQLTQAQVGKAITVTASYTDLQGTPESMTSSASAAVANVNDPATGGVTFTGTATQGQTLTAANTLADIDGLGTIGYQWLADGVAIAGATGSTLLLGQAQVGKAISVRGSFTDAFGAAESATSTASTAVANVNDAPTGTVVISGVSSVNQTLTVSNTLADLDGITGVIGYQWMRGGVDVAGATGTTYQLTAADLGAQMSVRASYTDGFGQAEVVASAATSAVVPNTPPTGAVTVTGTMAQNQVLSVSNNLTDADNGIATAITYQWLADGVAITGATGTTFTLTEAQVGKIVTARASYTDGLGTPETKDSASTIQVANVNDQPTGTVTIAGSAVQNQVLTASNTLVDIDGMGTVSYQWLADGAVIAGATSNTFTLTQAQVDKLVAVRATYTDGHGTVEQRSSVSTARVQNVNDAATGMPVILGAPTQGVTLSVNTSAVADADGMGNFNYQWLSDGAAIAGATAATFMLTQAQVGKAISVRTYFTDGYGAVETIDTASTAAVANVNDAVTGTVTIDGSAVVGMPLTAMPTLADIDGLGTFSYQWLVDGAVIAGATAKTFAPTATQAGKTVSVKVSYTDAFGTAESVTSSTVNVASEDDVTPLAAPGVTSVAGDGNGDGIKDSVQVQVVSAPFSKVGASGATENSFVTLVADSSASGGVNGGSTAVITSIDQEAIPTTGANKAPGQMTAPLGLIDFTATVTTGQTETFTLYADRSLGINGYWKQDASGKWVNLASEPYGGATTPVGNKMRLDFKITDGGEFDNDHVANGVIVDPGAIASMPLSLVGYAPDVTLTATTHFFF